MTENISGHADGSANDLKQQLEDYARLMSRPERWRSMADDDFVGMCVYALIRYGAERDEALIPLLFPLFTELADEFEVSDRHTVLSEIRPLLDEQKIHAMALLPLVICDDDQTVVSTATLELLAYSDPVMPEGLPYGLMELLPLAEKRVPRSLGAVLGGLVVYGDRRLRSSMNTVAVYCDDAQLAVAARCSSGFVTHAAMDFWLSICEGLQASGRHGDESRFGIAASALVNLRRGAVQPMVADIERQCPAPAFGEPVLVRRRWSLDDYAKHIKSRLQALADGERGEKIIPYVMRDWGLR